MPFCCIQRFICIVLKHGFANREFSFTLKDDVYLRYKSFQDGEEMKKEFLQYVPSKIDIGAIYTTKVCE
jgi:DNA primase small subunit